MTLSDIQIKEYLEEHLPYRLNSLRAWDLYIHRRKAKSYTDEGTREKCYWEGEHLQPALEISIVFGRSLLDFLGIKRDNMDLTTFEENEIKPIEKDSIFIWHVNPGKKAYPLEKINDEERGHLYNLIKIANKSAAHLTSKTSSKAEQESLEPAREIIYRLMMEYTDGLDKRNIWWHIK